MALDFVVSCKLTKAKRSSRKSLFEHLSHKTFSEYERTSSPWSYEAAALRLDVEKPWSFDFVVPCKLAEAIIIFS